MYFNKTTRTFDRISAVELRAALDDPRLPESFCVEAVQGYPALAIRTDETDTEDPDGLWYIGYIDLFDGHYHPRPRGAQDGINPTYEDLMTVADPEMVGV